MPRLGARTCAGRLAWTRRASCRSRTTTDDRRAQSAQLRPTPRPVLLVARQAQKSAEGHRCWQPPDRLYRQCRPTLRAQQPVVLALSSSCPPAFQELGSGRHRMDHCHTVVVVHDTDLERVSRPGWSNEHRDRRVVGLEGSPVVSECVGHVVVVDVVPACAWLNVHTPSLRNDLDNVNTC